MGMQFKVTITGEVTVSGIELDDLGYTFDAEEAFRGALSGYDFSIDEASVARAQVDITASVRVEDVEVAVEDLEDFDADTALNEHFGYEASAMLATFEVEEGPTGFSEVESVTDRDTAITVYAALARAGYEVN